MKKTAYLIWLCAISLILLNSLTTYADCTDGIQNEDEEGIDCGGSCNIECYDCHGKFCWFNPCSQGTTYLMDLTFQNVISQKNCYEDYGKWCYTNANCSVEYQCKPGLLYIDIGFCCEPSECPVGGEMIGCSPSGSKIDNHLCTNGEWTLTCAENWDCSEWSKCSKGNQTRTCLDLNECNTTFNKPIIFQQCTSCDDEIRDGDEEGIDCGGSCINECNCDVTIFEDGGETGVIQDNWQITSGEFSNAYYSTNQKFSGEKSIYLNGDSNQGSPRIGVETGVQITHPLQKLDNAVLTAKFFDDMDMDARNMIFLKSTSVLGGFSLEIDPKDGNIHNPNVYKIHVRRADDSYIIHGTSVQRSYGWHSMEIRISPTSSQFYVDGILEESNNEAMHVNKIQLIAGTHSLPGAMYYDNIKITTKGHCNSTNTTTTTTTTSTTTTIPVTCSNGIRDSDEDGIDCGGNCEGECYDCYGKFCLFAPCNEGISSLYDTISFEKSCYEDYGRRCHNNSDCSSEYACKSDGFNSFCCEPTECSGGNGGCFPSGTDPNKNALMVPLHVWCDNGTWQYFNCSNGIKDPDEEGIDCGGSCINECCEIPSCTENWNCTEWTECSSGTQTRTCADLNNCGTQNNKPSLQQECSDCYNGIKDGNEQGIDCGGYCTIQDCCENNQQDENEAAVDCGGVCKACPIEKHTITLNPFADSYVDSTRPLDNFGDYQRLFMGKDESRQLWALLNFNVDDLPDDAKITSARLKLYCINRSDKYTTSTFNVYGISSEETWYEMSVNWANKPLFSNLIASKKVEPRDCNGSQHYIYWESPSLTQFVQERIIESGSTLGIQGTDKLYLEFYSRESLVFRGAVPPMLTIKYTTVATCSNNVQDAGEEGVDCGGECPPCSVVDKLRPDVTITYPQIPHNGSVLRVSGTVNIQASATDNVGVTRVDFLLYTGSLSTKPVTLCEDFNAPYTCTWDTTSYVNGKYIISARAYDSVHNSNSSKVTAYVDNTPCADKDLDGYPDVECGGSDCNDEDDSIHPDAIDVCGDSIDQNCDGYDEMCQHCLDGRRNYAETDIDCGGDCGPCSEWKSCAEHADCVSQYCNPNNVCSIPSCNDGWQNQGEEDIDCGGLCDDCISCYDGKQNGDEEGVDCGGSCGDVLDCCYNGYRDLVVYETGVDCGGLCGLDKDEDGYISSKCGGDDCDDQNQFVHPSDWGNFETVRTFCDCNPYTGPGGRWGYGNGPTHGALEILADGLDNDCDGVIDEPTFSQEFTHYAENPQDVVFGPLESGGYGMLIASKPSHSSNDVKLEAFAVSGYKRIGQDIRPNVGCLNSLETIKRGTNRMMLLSGNNTIYNLFGCTNWLCNNEPVKLSGDINDIKATTFKATWEETGLLVLGDNCLYSGRFNLGSDSFEELVCSDTHFNGVGFYDNINELGLYGLSDIVGDRILVSDASENKIRIFDLGGTEYTYFPQDSDIFKLEDPTLIEVDRGKIHLSLPLDMVAGQIFYVVSQNRIYAFNNEGKLLTTLSNYLDIENGEYVLKDFKNIEKIYLQKDPSILGGEQQFLSVVDRGSDRVINYQITGVEATDPCLLPEDVAIMTACIPYLKFIHLGYTLCESSLELEDATATGLVASSLSITLLEESVKMYSESAERFIPIMSCVKSIAPAILRTEEFSQTQYAKANRILRRNIESKADKFCTMDKSECIDILTDEYIHFMNKYPVNPNEYGDIVLNVIIPESDIEYEIKAYDHSYVHYSQFNMFGHNISIFVQNTSKQYYVDIKGIREGHFGLNLIQSGEVEVTHIYFENISVDNNTRAKLEISDTTRQILIDRDSDGEWDESINVTSVDYYPLDDVDGDGILNQFDNCYAEYNPNQSDSDNDSIGDVCDSCIYDAANDLDMDGVCGNVDNCLDVFNPLQNDTDSNGIGDACEPTTTSSTITTTSLSSTTTTTPPTATVYGHIVYNQLFIPNASVDITCLDNGLVAGGNADSKGYYRINVSCPWGTNVTVDASTGPVEICLGSRCRTFNGGCGSNSTDISPTGWALLNVFIDQNPEVSTTSTTTTSTTTLALAAAAPSAASPLVVTTTSSSTPSTVPQVTTTTLSEMRSMQQCALAGDNPVCGEVTLQEVISMISVWTTGGATLEDTISLISAWENSV